MPDQEEGGSRILFKEAHESDQYCVAAPRNTSLYTTRNTTRYTTRNTTELLAEAAFWSFEASKEWNENTSRFFCPDRKWTLPSSLQTLKFGELFNQSLGCVMLPSSLQTLTFGDLFNESLAFATLPSSLQTLTLGLNFDQTLAGGTLPSSLQTLTFGYFFNETLAGVTLPNSLQTLTFGCHFNQPADFDFWINFNESCEGGRGGFVKGGWLLGRRGWAGLFEGGRGLLRRGGASSSSLHPGSTKKPTSLPLPCFEEATTPLQDSEKGCVRDRRPCQRVECE